MVRRDPWFNNVWTFQFRIEWRYTKKLSLNRIAFVTRITPWIVHNDASLPKKIAINWKDFCDFCDGSNVQQPHYNTPCVFRVRWINGEQGCRTSRSGPISVPAEAAAHFASNYYQMYDITSSTAHGKQLASRNDRAAFRYHRDEIAVIRHAKTHSRLNSMRYTFARRSTASYEITF